MTLKPGSAWLGAPTVFALALVTPYARAQAAGTIEIAADEVYLDLATHRFGAALAAEPGAQIKVALIAPKDSSVTLIYWPEPDSQACAKAGETAKPPDGAQRRAAAPSGPSEGNRQKFVVRIGPLQYRYRQSYCFSTELVKTSTLSDSEKAEVSAALDRSLRLFMTSPPDASGTRPVQDSACFVNDPAQIPADCIAATFVKQLGWGGDRLRVLEPGSDRSISFRAAFTALLSADPEFKNRLEEALGQAHSAQKALEQVRGSITKAYEEVTRWPADLVIDPIPDVIPNDVVNGLRGPDADTLKKQLAPLVSDKAKFVKELRRQRAALSKTPPALPRKQADQLNDLLLYVGDEPEYLKFDKAKRQSALDDLLKIARNSDLEAALKKEGAEYAALDPAKKPYGFDATKYAGLVETRIWLNDAGKALDIWVNANTSLDKLIAGSPGYATFRDRLRAVIRTERTGLSAPFTPSFKDRFPFYVSADVGFAALWFTGKVTDDKATTLGELLPYFGLNFYFEPLDKDEPLPRCPFIEAGRRFAVMAGMTLSSTTLHSAQGVSGPVGGRVPLLGVGYRLSDYFRIGGGAFMYTQTSTNPLSDGKDVRVGGFGSLSIDVDVVDTVSTWVGNAKKL